MRVGMYYTNDDVRVEEMEVPKIKGKEVLVRVMASGICGSDVMEWYRKKQAPKVLGHEVAGTIAEVGDKVTGYKVGDRVVVTHHVPCNSCSYCLDGHQTTCDMLRTTHFDPGGFAEYLRVPEINVERGMWVLPDHLSFEEGTFVEPLGCVVRAQKLVGMEPGKSVLVIGSGLSGLLHIKLARASGASRIFATDIDAYRLQTAAEQGAKTFASHICSPERLRYENGGRLADRVILCTGHLAAIRQAFESVERGGRIMFFAPPKPDEKVELPMTRLWKDEVAILSSYGASPQDMEESLRLLSTGSIAVKDMITHRLSLDEILLGFQLTARPQNSLKVIIEPWRRKEECP